MIAAGIGRPLLVTGLAGTALAVTLAFAAPASAASGCNADWRGDRVCIRAQGNLIEATGNDKYSPAATVYLTILRSAGRQVVAGPVEAHDLEVRLPPGSYFASYYVQTVDFGGTEVGSPVVRV